MKVKKLIRELQKMPQNLEVSISAHDHSDWETAGDAITVDHCIKEDLRENYALNEILSKQDLDCFEDKPKEWINIHG